MRKVEDVMRKNLPLIAPNTSLYDALQLMKAQNIKHLIISSSNNIPEGLISDRDIKKIISPFIGTPKESEADKATLKIPVKSIAIKSIITCKIGDDIKKAIELMLQKNISCVPILDENNKIAGMITIVEVLKFVLNLL